LAVRKQQLKNKKMAKIGTYCKAYPVKQLRQYPQWQKVETNQQISDDKILYIQENYIVTEGIFQDENIIFDDVTLEWQEFCQQILKFQIPQYETA
jgi:aspartyl/asparaginyl beta-hydroxylase (cupin superfamily)